MSRKIVFLLALVGLLAPGLALLIAESQVGRSLERRAYDGWFSIRGPLPTPDSVVLVSIDLESEESLGRYPWSREWHTQLIRNLARGGARVVAFDATFADPFPAQDSTLRRVIDSTGIAILGAKTQQFITRDAEGFRLEEPVGVLREVPIGIVDNLVDPVDGVIRAYPILREYPQRSVPELGVRAVMRFLGIPEDSLVRTPEGWRMGDREIPRGLGDAMLIDFLGRRGSVSTYSYASVVDDAQTDIGDWDMDEFDLLNEEGRFQNKIVLVGTTIPEHQDEHPTPFRARDQRAGWMAALFGLLGARDQTAALLTPGVEIHAHAVQTLLTGRHIVTLPRPLQYLWVLLLGALAALITPRTRGLWGAALTIALAAGALYASWWSFSEQGVWLWAFAPLLSLGMTYAGSTATLYLAEQQEKARLRGMFQHYVASSVVDELIKRPELLALGGEERVISVLFTDVQDFSSISEKLTPTKLVELLNEYLTAMTDIILSYGGIVDKYQGDSIMAEFGVPVPVEDHALRACHAALDMVDELARLREGWAAEGRPQLFARVGINTGKALVGNLGSHRIMDYTVMGDHVNLASRLEGANKLYGSRIMVSEYTWEIVEQDVIGRELDRITVKGKERPVRVYEVIARRSKGVPPEVEALVGDFGAALALYQSGSFAEALQAFRTLAESHPDDGPTALYIERCREYLTSPPPSDWEGVYRMTTK